VLYITSLERWLVHVALPNMSAVYSKMSGSKTRRTLDHKLNVCNAGLHSET